MSAKLLIAILLLAAMPGCATSPFALRPSQNALGETAKVEPGLAATQAATVVRAAEAAEEQGKPDEAIRMYEQARVLGPQLADLSRRLAVLYDQRGDADRARAAYEQAIAQHPGNADLLNDFGVYQLQREQPQAAEQWFRRALAVQPEHERATVNLGIALCLQGRLEESYATFTRVVSPAAAYSNIGVLLAQQHSPAAEQHLRRALELDPNLPQPSQFLAHLTKDR